MTLISKAFVCWSGYVTVTPLAASCGNNMKVNQQAFLAMSNNMFCQMCDCSIFCRAEHSFVYLSFGSGHRQFETKISNFWFIIFCGLKRFLSRDSFQKSTSWKENDPNFCPNQGNPVCELQCLKITLFFCFLENSPKHTNKHFLKCFCALLLSSSFHFFRTGNWPWFKIDRHPNVMTRRFEGSILWNNHSFSKKPHQKPAGHHWGSSFPIYRDKI